MAKRWMLVAIVVAVAGCGGPASPQLVEVHSDAGAAGHGQTTAAAANSGQVGNLAGVVVDEGIHPLEGASVRLTGLSLTRTAQRDGSFVFTDLAPTAYHVEASANGYDLAEALVLVPSAGTAHVKFVLAAQPPPTPYHVTQAFEGFSDVTSSPFLAGNVSAGSTEAGSVFAATLDRPHATLVLEATMPPNSTPGGNNSFEYSVASQALPNSDRVHGAAPNPMRILVPASALGNLTELRLQVNPVSVPVPEFEKTYHVYLTAWYNGAPPDGWAILHGDS